MYSLIQSLPTLLLLVSCLPTIVKCQHHHRQLRHAPSNDNRQSNDYIDPIIEPSTQLLDTPTLPPSSFHVPVEEDTSLPPTYTFTTTTTSYDDDDNNDAPYPPLPLPISAFQSKMTPSLVHLHSIDTSSLQTTTTVPTSQPISSDTIDGAPSKLSLSTITPPTLNTSSTNKLFQQNEQLSFTNSLYSASNTDDDDASTEVVQCNSSSAAAKDTSIEPYHIIELPYYYQNETTQLRSTIIVEQSILSAMADHILTCDEYDKEEDIRHRALSNEQLKSRVVAVSSDQSNKRECK